MTANRYRISSRGDENVRELDSDCCVTLNILKITEMYTLDG